MWGDEFGEINCEEMLWGVELMQDVICVCDVTVNVLDVFMERRPENVNLSKLNFSRFNADLIFIIHVLRLH